MKKATCIECDGTGETWDRTNEEDNGADITECEHCGGSGEEPEVPEAQKKTTKKKARAKR